MQARQAHTTARHNRAADPLQRFLPTLRTTSGRSGGSLQRVCHRIGRAAPAPRLPACIHLSMAKNAARCMSPRSTLRCPMHRTPLAIAPHSIPSARTTLLLHHRISPSGTPHPWLHQKPARCAGKASERNRKPPHSTRSSPFHSPKSPIADCRKTHFPSQNSLFKFPIQCIS